MSETKHTPGPWNIDKEYACHSNIAAGDVLICKTACGSPSDDEERAANARLIAASPELLEALKSVEWVVEEDDGREDYCARCDRLKPYGHTETCGTAVAIAKAEGRTK